MREAFSSSDNVLKTRRPQSSPSYLKPLKNEQIYSKLCSVSCFLLLRFLPAPNSALHQGFRNLFVTFGSSLDLNCGAPKVFQPRMYLEIIRMDGVTQLTPDGDKITLTGRILTIHGLDSRMQGKIICKVVSSCTRTREDVDLGFLLPVPQKGAYI